MMKRSLLALAAVVTLAVAVPRPVAAGEKNQGSCQAIENVGLKTILLTLNLKLVWARVYGHVCK